MDRAHNEPVHLNEKVTLVMFQRYSWWIGTADSGRWWIRRHTLSKNAFAKYHQMTIRVLAAT